MTEAPRTLSDGVVRLRTAEERDTEAIAAGIVDPDVVRWIGPPEGSAADVLALNRRRAARGSPTFCVCEGDDRCVGLVWMNRNADDPSSGSIGYWLLPAARGRGLATRAVRLLAAWAQGPGSVVRLRITADADNAASRAVAERSGFREFERRVRVDAAGRGAQHVVYIPADTSPNVRVASSTRGAGQPSREPARRDRSPQATDPSGDG
ncbi:MAG TPA: GNAT family N-acetyltransferase [Candidatus Limnocylindrales bacterium]|nr:GNAT family N-acetyltransferase [Candidatus Limnocylindrales bacterium]